MKNQMFGRSLAEPWRTLPKKVFEMMLIGLGGALCFVLVFAFGTAPSRSPPTDTPAKLEVPARVPAAAPAKTQDPVVATASPTGEWIVQNGSVVRITKCGTAFCGYVVTGPPGKDYRNPDPRKRDRALTGIQVIFGMKPNGPNSWSGETYSAEDGRKYKSIVSIVSPSTLLIEDCASEVGACQSQTWERTR